MAYPWYGPPLSSLLLIIFFSFLVFPSSWSVWPSPRKQWAIVNGLISSSVLRLSVFSTTGAFGKTGEVARYAVNVSLHPLKLEWDSLRCTSAKLLHALHIGEPNTVLKTCKLVESRSDATGIGVNCSTYCLPRLICTLHGRPTFRSTYQLSRNLILLCHCLWWAFGLYNYVLRCDGCEWIGHSCLLASLGAVTTQQCSIPYQTYNVDWI